MYIFLTVFVSKQYCFTISRGSCVREEHHWVSLPVSITDIEMLGDFQCCVHVILDKVEHVCIVVYTPLYPG